MRETIISNIGCDIIGLNETFLKGNETINITGYTSICHNRKILNPKSCRGSGGVAILISNHLLIDQQVRVLDNTYEGILWVKIEQKEDPENNIVVCSCYLPPEASSRGNSEQEFFDKLTETTHAHTDENPFIIIGDFNSRIGKRQDVKDLDFIQRTIIDETTNQHGKHLIDFLNDNNLCILNGRITPEKDNFTSTGRGKAVVDYIITSVEDINKYSEVEVLTITDLVSRSHTPIRSETTKLPDHSMLLCKLHLHYQLLTENRKPAEQKIAWKGKKLQKYKLNNLNNTILDGEEMKSIIIDAQHQANTNPTNLNTNYTNLITEIQGLFKRTIGTKKETSNTSKKQTSRHKPFWNNTLEKEWKNLVADEKKYMKCKGTKIEQRNLRKLFFYNRKKFNINIRKAERQYNAKRRQKIESFNKNNPKEFWSHVNNLGPRQNKKNDFRTKKINGELEEDPTKIKQKWKEDFSELYNNNIETVQEQTADARPLLPNVPNTIVGGINFNGRTFVSKAIKNVPEINPDWLNSDITLEEVQWATAKCKLEKAGGLDQIPNELWKHKNLQVLLYTLFKEIFNKGNTPKEWSESIIKPLLKAGKDINEPLSYRGISLMPTAAKIFTSILNNRLKHYLEKNSLLCDEQNGFREKRSCLDHIFTLTTILRNKIAEKINIYSCFVDFAKAFDSVNHEILWVVLKSNGLHGKFLNIIKDMYKNLQAAVNLEENLTDWFHIKGGVRQGDNLAPTLFAMYINSLATVIKDQKQGVKFEDEELSILLYADDIVILSETEAGLQKLLDSANGWIQHNKMSANMEKTKIVHFRKAKAPLTKTQFYLGKSKIEGTTEYKYLGLSLNENLNYQISNEKLASSAGKALGAATSKYLKAKGLHFKTYSKIYDVTVLPILHYASPIWGQKSYQKSTDIHQRAMRTFLGVGKKSPIPALYGETGWHNLTYHKTKDSLNYWLKLFNMENQRITKKVFIWDYKKALTGKNCWNKDIKEALTEINMEDVFYGLDIENTSRKKQEIQKKLQKLDEERTMLAINNMPKLRTYKTLKTAFGTPTYINSRIPKSHRTVITKLRIGVYPINIETGRHRKEKLENRTCPRCRGQVEDETHYLIDCPLYGKMRSVLYKSVNTALQIEIETLNSSEKLQILLDSPKIAMGVATYVKEAYDTRNTFIKTN